MPKVGMKEIRQDQVIEATKRCIVARGLSRMSVKDIAAEAGVSTGIIYHYFKNKEDLLLQVLKSSFRASHEQVMDTVQPLKGANEKLGKHIEAITRTPKDNPEFFAVLMNYLGEATQNEQVRGIVVKFFNNLKSYMRDYLAESDVQQSEQAGKEHLPTLIYALGLGLGIMWTLDSTAYDIEDMSRAIKQHFTNP